MRFYGLAWPTVAVGLLVTAPASAQPDLPPPPPPPIGEPTELPPPPPPRATSTSPAPAPPPPRAASRPPPPSPAPPPPPVYRPRVHRHTDVVFVPEEPPPETRRVAVTLNPLGLFWGRLSLNAEVQLAPHHALVGSPNVLIWPADRGGGRSLISEGLGFASHDSAGFGVELGYHYWWDWRRTLRGPFLGPSLLLGVTSQATTGDPTQTQGYAGVAFDVGEQEVLPGGFTVGAGAGLGVIHMADSSALFPRLLAQIGWSF